MRRQLPIPAKGWVHVYRHRETKRLMVVRSNCIHDFDDVTTPKGYDLILFTRNPDLDGHYDNPAIDDAPPDHRWLYYEPGTLYDDGAGVALSPTQAALVRAALNQEILEQEDPC